MDVKGKCEQLSENKFNNFWSCFEVGGSKGEKENLGVKNAPPNFCLKEWVDDGVISGKFLRGRIIYR